jgi:o-succinylbenzoate synthase
MDILTVEHAELYAYSLPIYLPLKINNISVHQRRGYLIKLILNDGFYQFGEIAPLPGLHTEQFDDIPDMISSNINHIKGLRLTGHLEDLQQISIDQYSAPSVRFGLESAMFSLIMRRTEEAGERFLNKMSSKINVNALIDPSLQPIDTALQKVRSAGFNCLKIKTGRQPLEQEIQIVKRLCQKTGSSLRLRIDSNRAWSLEEALEFSRAIPTVNIEYFEEPLQQTADLHEFFRQSGVPIAVDESLLERDPYMLLDMEWIDTFVIKPAVWGGIYKSIQFMDAADRKQKKVVISDTFHCGVGVTMNAILAAQKRSIIPAAGMDTYTWLDDQVLNEPLQFIDGALSITESLKRNCNLNFSHLKRII